MSQFPEPEWKKLRAIREKVLNRFCVKALAEVKDILEKSDLENQAHKAYLATFSSIRDSDKEVANLFNDWRRSTASMTLLKWMEFGLLTENEFDSFSDEIKERIRKFMKLNYFDTPKA
jgi:hypothetical protein